MVLLAVLLAGCATTARPTPVTEARGSSSLDPTTRDYLVHVRQMITAQLTYPPDAYKWAHAGRCWQADRVVVEINILRDGQLQSVAVRESSECLPYNESVLKAVRDAAPFPSIPEAMLPGMTHAMFRLSVEYSWR